METSWRDRLRVELPYGCWIAANGLEVLFNVQGKPLWQRQPGRPAERATGRPDEILDEKYFFSRYSLPSRNRGALRRCQAILAEWGVPGP